MIELLKIILNLKIGKNIYNNKIRYIILKYKFVNWISFNRLIIYAIFINKHHGLMNY